MEILVVALANLSVFALLLYLYYKDRKVYVLVWKEGGLTGIVAASYNRNKIEKAAIERKKERKDVEYAIVGLTPYDYWS